MIEINEKILNNEEFNKLKLIGGCKDYHNEGDALIHTMLVYDEAKKMFGDNHWMTTVALLHDIGKIYCGEQKENGDWHYPNHANIGAEKLENFVSKDDCMFETYKWYIQNHIKPLFWRFKGIKTIGDMNDLCTLDNLRKLAICDLRGSHSAIDQSGLIKYLEELDL